MTTGLIFMIMTQKLSQSYLFQAELFVLVFAMETCFIHPKQKTVQELLSCLKCEKFCKTQFQFQKISMKSFTEITKWISLLKFWLVFMKNLF